MTTRKCNCRRLKSALKKVFVGQKPCARRINDIGPSLRYDAGGCVRPVVDHGQANHPARPDKRKICMSRKPGSYHSQLSRDHRFAGLTVIQSLLEREIAKRPDKVRFSGRILFLTEDPELIRRQLAGRDLPWGTKNPANNP